MSKIKQEQAAASSLITQQAEPAAETAWAEPAEPPRESKVHRLSHEQELYTPKQREGKIPSQLTVE